MSTHYNNTNDESFDEALLPPRFPSNDEEIAEMEELQVDVREREFDDERFSGVDDMSDDADALASAGHGMDEDYGDPRDDWDNAVEVDYDRE